MIILVDIPTTPIDVTTFSSDVAVENCSREKRATGDLALQIHFASIAVVGRHLVHSMALD